MKNGRVNKSRSRELDVLKSLVLDQSYFLNFLNLNHSGGIYDDGNVIIEYGNISRLLIDYIPQEFKLSSKISSQVKMAFHVDHISKNRKLQIEKELGLSKGIISDGKSKVDILLFTNDGPLCISMKDDNSISKLGQVSGYADYNGAELRGGLMDLQFDIGDKDLAHYNTKLSPRKFDKLSENNKRLAVYKTIYTYDFSMQVEERLNLSIGLLMTFAEQLKNSKSCVIEFVRKTFTGNAPEGIPYYIYFGEVEIDFWLVLKNLEDRMTECDYSLYQTAKKTSLIISLSVAGKSYYLTKIEPSFDGSNVFVSQTKGIIYYFQQHPNEGNNYKKLFQDLIQ
jgi:hypothetical protein